MRLDHARGEDWAAWLTPVAQSGEPSVLGRRFESSQGAIMNIKQELRRVVERMLNTPSWESDDFNTGWVAACEELLIAMDGEGDFVDINQMIADKESDGV